MNEFEYSLLENEVDDFDVTPKEILNQIGKDWTPFESENSDSQLVAEEIMLAKYSDWEIYDEGVEIYLAVRKVGEDEFDLYRTSLFYSVEATAEAEIVYMCEDEYDEEEETM